MSRAPYGARGLKSVAALYGDEVYIGRAPYGARGLKSHILFLPALLA